MRIDKIFFVLSAVVTFLLVSCDNTPKFKVIGAVGDAADAAAKLGAG